MLRWTKWLHTTKLLLGSTRIHVKVKDVWIIRATCMNRNLDTTRQPTNNQTVLVFLLLWKWHLFVFSPLYIAGIILFSYSFFCTPPTNKSNGCWNCLKIYLARSLPHLITEEWRQKKKMRAPQLCPSWLRNVQVSVMTTFWDELQRTTQWILPCCFFPRCKDIGLF